MATTAQIIIFLLLFIWKEKLFCRNIVHSNLPFFSGKTIIQDGHKKKIIQFIPASNIISNNLFGLFFSTFHQNSKRFLHLSTVFQNRQFEIKFWNDYGCKRRFEYNEWKKKNEFPSGLKCKREYFSEYSRFKTEFSFEMDFPLYFFFIYFSLSIATLSSLSIDSDRMLHLSDKYM